MDMGINIKVNNIFKPVKNSLTELMSLLLNDISYVEIFLAGCLTSSGFYIVLSFFFWC